MTSWPGMGQELARKSISALEKWIRAHERGKISSRELYLISDTIYDTISGLAPHDICEIVAGVVTESKNMALEESAQRKAKLAA
ncbi:MAG: hypothetical protein ACEQSB_00625 [Undibacterium sp.]